MLISFVDNFHSLSASEQLCFILKLLITFILFSSLYTTGLVDNLDGPSIWTQVQATQTAMKIQRNFWSTLARWWWLVCGCPAHMTTLTAESVEMQLPITSGFSVSISRLQTWFTSPTLDWIALSGFNWIDSAKHASLRRHGQLWAFRLRNLALTLLLSELIAFRETYAIQCDASKTWSRELWDYWRIGAGSWVLHIIPRDLATAASMWCTFNTPITAVLTT